MKWRKRFDGKMGEVTCWVEGRTMEIVMKVCEGSMQKHADSMENIPTVLNEETCLNLMKFLKHAENIPSCG